MTKPNSTEIVFVVDRSGSMSSIAADMRGGFDTFIADQKKVPGKCCVSLAQFDDVYELVYEGRLLVDVPPLELVPRSRTALLDAVGRTIESVGARLAKLSEAERPSKILFVIITDGAENASSEYKHDRIVEMITTQREKYKWDFVFLGANQDAFTVAEALGIQRGNAMNYAHSTKGAQGMSLGLSDVVRSYRGAKDSKDLGGLQASYDLHTQGTDDKNKKH